MSPIRAAFAGVAERAYGFGSKPSVFELIETQTVGAGGAPSITFSSIPGTYKHLQIRAVARSTYNAADSFVTIRVNSDSGSNYTNHYLSGDGASATSGSFTTRTWGALSWVTGNTATSSQFGALIIDLLDYASTSKNKTFRTLAGNDRNGAGTVGLASSAWLSTSAITSIQLGDFPNGGNLAQYSTFSLFGCK